MCRSLEANFTSDFLFHNEVPTTWIPPSGFLLDVVKGQAVRDEIGLFTNAYNLHS